MLKAFIFTALISVVFCSKPYISKEEVFAEGNWKVALVPSRNTINCEWSIPEEHASKFNKTCDKCNCTVQLYTWESFVGSLTFTLREGHRTHEFVLHVKSSAGSALYSLSTSAIYDLLHAKYQFLWISHFHNRHEAYHPKVGKFFHERFEETAKMIFTITEYIKMKQASISEKKPNFHRYMIEQLSTCEVQMFFESSQPTNMVESFEAGIKIDRTMVDVFTNIASLADENEDAELHEFVSNDIIPLYTSALKTSSNHLMTLKGMQSTVTETTRLSEFLFDKYI